VIQVIIRAVVIAVRAAAIKAAGIREEVVIQVIIRAVGIAVKEGAIRVESPTSRAGSHLRSRPCRRKE